MLDQGASRHQLPKSGAGSAGTKGALTRQAILDAAIVRFGRDGFRSTSVADIARDAAVGGTVAYAYFPSKVALFLAAVDEDAASMIDAGVDRALTTPDASQWPREIAFAVLATLDRHPLARRLLAGLEPEVTGRVLGIPTLADLRATCAERLRADQLTGAVRADIDPVMMADGIVTIMLSLLMSLVQLGEGTADRYAAGVTAVFRAAIAPVGTALDA